MSDPAVSAPSILVRRSNLVVPVEDADAVRSAWRHDADAVTLDLRNADATDSRALDAAVADAGKGGAEVFVRVSVAQSRGGLESAISQRIAGIVIEADSAAVVSDVSEALAEIERTLDIAEGALGLIVLLGTARGVWDIRSIIKASPRVSQVGIDERALAADLGIDPDPEYDPFEYARGRLAVEATAAKVAAIGMAYPMSVQQPANASRDQIHAMASKARNLGMKGVLCPHASWLEPVNAAFTPTPELVAYNKRVREAFAAGVAAGTAAVPLDGRMIDVPVDEWAIVVLATADACAARDAEKRAAAARHA